MCKMAVLGKGSMRDRKKVRIHTQTVTLHPIHISFSLNRPSAHAPPGGGTATQWRPAIRTSFRGPARRDFHLHSAGRGARPYRLRPGRGSTLPGTGEYWLYW